MQLKFKDINEHTGERWFIVKKAFGIQLFIKNKMTENSESFNDDSVAIICYLNTPPAAGKNLGQEYQIQLQLYPYVYSVNPSVLCKSSGLGCDI